MEKRIEISIILQLSDWLHLFPNPKMEKSASTWIGPLYDVDVECMRRVRSEWRGWCWDWSGKKESEIKFLLNFNYIHLHSGACYGSVVHQYKKRLHKNPSRKRWSILNYYRREWMQNMCKRESFRISSLCALSRLPCRVFLCKSIICSFDCSMYQINGHTPSTIHTKRRPNEMHINIIYNIGKPFNL